MSELIDQIEQIAKMADLPANRKEDVLVFAFDMGGGRRQLVHVLPVGETDDGMHVICFFSPCQEVREGIFGGLSRAKAMQFLRLNSELLFGHFAILMLGGHEYVCVRTTQLLETMEVEEFKAHVISVAGVADEWEAKLGKDLF